MSSAAHDEKQLFYCKQGRAKQIRRRKGAKVHEGKKQAKRSEFYRKEYKGDRDE